MATTNFVDYTTVIPAAWLNDVNTLTYSLAQRGTGAVLRPATSKHQEEVSVFDFLSLAERTDVLARTALVNVAVGVQAGIDYASSIGARLKFPAGVYLIGTTQLQWKNHGSYVGEGKDSSRATGTVIQYSGVNDLSKIVNPINSSTAANIIIKGITLYCTTRTAGKGCIADLGSTFLTIDEVCTLGNDFGVILDQSQLAIIQNSEFDMSSASQTAGIWLVNGAIRTVGALTFWTNRITIRNNQFNGGATGIGIASDGGVLCSIKDNNLFGMNKSMRLTDCYCYDITDNYMESMTTTGIEYATTMVGGSGGGFSYCNKITENYFSSASAISFITIAVSSLDKLTAINNGFNNPNAGGSAFSGLVNVADYEGFGNKQFSIGSASVGNSFTPMLPYTPTFTSSIGDAAIGNGTMTNSNYTRNGGACTATANFTFGGTTAKGTGQFRLSLPFANLSAGVIVGSWYAIQGANFWGGPCVAAAGGSYVTLLQSGVGVIGGATYLWAAGDVVNITITYPIAQTV